MKSDTGYDVTVNTYDSIINDPASVTADSIIAPFLLESNVKRKDVINKQPLCTVMVTD